jgi:uncharacterized protein
MGDAAAYFGDTVFFLALTNSRDQWHRTAIRWQTAVVLAGRRLVTTELVLVEVANSLARPDARRRAVELIDVPRGSDRVDIVPPTGLFDAALALYRSRPDKAWSLTDCASFVAMRERGLSAALTSDHHFRQAGFVALMLDDPEP